jgi:hypothetical protein
MQKDVLKAAGISMEGANLSGLSEEPSELVTLLCNMAKEVHDKKIVGKEKKKKQKEKETAMNMTEKLALAQQGCSGGIKQEVTDEHEGHSSKHSSGRKRGRSFMDDFNGVHQRSPEITIVQNKVTPILNHKVKKPIEQTLTNDTIKISWPVVL